MTYENLLLEFQVEGKGMTTHPISSLGTGAKLKFSRNHSWSAAGDKRIRATVYSSGRTQQVAVETSFRVSHLGQPTSSAELNVRCFDGSRKRESDL